MKAIYVHKRGRHSVEIHFSRELPLFPKHQRTLRTSEPKVMLTRSVDMERVAELMAQVNVGKICVEMGQPRATFRQFILDLIVLDGVEMLVDAERYTLTIRVGRCFTPETVCRSVAECIQRHFYPAEQLECENQLGSHAAAISDDDRLEATNRASHGRN